MTDGSTATIDIKELFNKEDVTLENYARFREAALANENNTKALEELADKLDADNAKNAVKKGIAFWLLGKTQSGKTSIIRYLTGADDAVIGSGFRPCTKTSRQFQFPSPEAPLGTWPEQGRASAAQP